MLTSALSEALGLGVDVRGFWAAFWGALVVSLVSTILSLFIRDRRDAYAWGIVQAYRERSMLMGAMAGTPPVDGKWAAVSGTIHSSSPITARTSSRLTCFLPCM